MAGEGSKRVPGDDAPASRAEIDALGEIIAATIAMAVRAQSGAAAVLLERALVALNERMGTACVPDDDGLRPTFRPS